MSGEQETTMTATAATSAKTMVIHLMEIVGMSASEISEAMAHRVSRRTIYRWAKGESIPQQNSDLAALAQIYNDSSEGVAKEVQ